MIFAVYLCVIIVLLYASLIASFTRSWLQLKTFNCDNKTQEKLQISIIIPFRNEEENIANLISDLEDLEYSRTKLEILFIDDESSDNSVKLINNALSTSKLSYKLLHSTGGKKKAVQKGLMEALGDFVISLDADVRFGPQLIDCYNTYYQEYHPKLIAGPVAFTKNASLLSKLLSVEFSSLISTGAAAIAMGKPMMLNAANMGFERKVALEFQEEVYQSDIASGDDQFLMEAIERKYGGNSIHFLKSEQATVHTSAPESIKAFLNQRVRWASKTSSYTSRYSQFVAIVVFAINLLLLLSLAYSIMQYSAVPFLILYFIKTIIDLPILLSATAFFKQQRMHFYFPLLQFLYPWYIVVVAVWSIFGSYSWKGREY